MESKVTKLAGELVHRLHSPRVLHYAAPESRPPFVREWLKSGWWGTALRTAALCLIVIGFARPSLIGLLTIVAGLMLALLVQVAGALRELGH